MSTHVLIVDDEHDLLGALQGILEDEGFDVRTASSAFEALGKISEEPPGVILLDVMMPHMSGWEARERIAKIPGARGVPVVMMSAVDPTPEQRRKGHFVSKPFDFDHLVATVRRLFEDRRAKAA